MKNHESLSHTRYDCKYHVVFIPKYRRKKIYGAIRRHLGEIFHELAKQKESRILEGHLKGDHVHMCISIPPKFAVSSVVGFMKGKSAISIARNFPGARVGALVQHATTLGADRKCRPGRVRDELLSIAGRLARDGETQLKQSPENPERFSPGAHFVLSSFLTVI